MTRHRPALIAAAVALALPLSLVVAPAAQAVTYPTWSDVEKARSSASATQTVIAQIKHSLATLTQNAQSAEQQEKDAGDAAQQADDAYQAQVLKVSELASQVKDATDDEDAARERVARIVAAEYRSGGEDPELELLLHSSDAADLLDAYGTAQRLGAQNQQVLEQAQQTANTVSSLKDQASTAQTLLAQDKQKADDTLAAAQTASQKADDAVAAQQAHESDLEALLAVAQHTASTTYSQYEAGVRARAAAAARAKAKAQQGDPAATTSSGWTLPARGPITSPYGWRTLFGQPEFHRGTDIGAACGAPEYAAHDGTVIYAGWNGVYGYYVGVSTGGGVEVDYGHIEEGGILVSYGQHVSAGQVIARVGTTGESTGCHLFFGVKVDGAQTDPQPFMAARGVTLGTY